jgi:hypothetical protein
MTYPAKGRLQRIIAVVVIIAVLLLYCNDAL